MNILFLLADQMRYDALSCNGAPICQTPSIDSLASQGVNFDGAYTTCALCSPARASIVTGLYPHNHGQLANQGNFNGVFDHTLSGVPTYFSCLKEQGYQTGYVGKWHLDREGDGDFWKIDHWATDRNFHEDLQKDGLSYNVARDEVQPLEWGEDAPFYGPSVLDAEHHHDGWVANKTIDILDEFSKQDKPFVLCAGFFGPHFPYAVPKPYDTLYRPEDVPRWINFDETFEKKPAVQQKELMRWNTAQLTWPDWQKVIAAYWGYCTYIDSCVNKILNHLQKTGHLEDTLIVFTADHGDNLGSHRLFNKGFNMYEEDNHIPMVIRLPGSKYSGTRCKQYVSLADLMPTFTEIAQKQGIQVDGESLLPLLRGEIPSYWRKEAYVEFNGYESTLLTSRMIRNERWKYVYNPFEIDELYDMQSDPGELRNLAGMPAFSHVLRRMKAKMVKHLQDSQDGIVECSSWQSNSYGLIVSDREI